MLAFFKFEFSFILERSFSIDVGVTNPPCCGPYAMMSRRVLEVFCTLPSASVNVSELDYLSRDNDLKQGEGDLEALLHYSKLVKCSDVRDHVYAFLGLASREYQINIGYAISNTWSAVCLDATKQIILKNKSLDVLLSSGE